MKESLSSSEAFLREQGYFELLIVEPIFWATLTTVASHAVLDIRHMMQD